MQLAEGAVFARDFRVVRPLREGGMGAVYVVEQISTRTQRALKLMQPELLSSPRLRRRFEQEAWASAQVKSDHVVQIIGAGVDDATQAPWLAMELLEGEDLEAAVERRGAWPLSEALLLLGQLCEALGAVHAAGIVHRDLKPGNVFLARPRGGDAPFMVKLLDFGIARVATEPLTTRTTLMGSPRWMAPEQTRSGPGIGPATDLWALGLLAYYVLTGRSYFLETELAPLLEELVVRPLPLASVRAREQGREQSLPVGFDGWFCRCVHREPAARHDSAAAALAALRAALDGRGDPGRTARLEDDGLHLYPGNLFAERYQVLRVLHRDRWAGTYLVTLRSGDRTCCLRVMAAIWASTEGQRRFAAALGAWRQVSGESIAAVLDHGVDATTGSPWVVVEGPGGESLAALVARRRGLPQGEVQGLLLQVCQGLAAAHRQGVVHRALGPESIEVISSGRVRAPHRVRLLDFGVGRAALDLARRGDSGGATLREEEWLALWQWVAPEDTSSAAAVQPAADQWALGLLAFFLWSGRAYFQPGGASFLAERLGALPRASQRALEVGAPGPLPPGFDQWFGRCTAADPRGRFPSIEAAGQALAAMLSPTVRLPQMAADGAATRGSAVPEPGRLAQILSAPWPIAAAAILLCLGLLLFTLFQR